MDVVGKAFHQESFRDSEGNEVNTDVSPKEVGHNVYILCHQLSNHNEGLRKMMQNKDNLNDSLAQALAHYRENTAQIEVFFNH